MGEGDQATRLPTLIQPLKTFLQNLYNHIQLKHYQLMITTPFLCTLMIIACFVGVQASPCPYPNHPGSVHSNQIIAALSTGSIPLFENQEIQCYNYSLPNGFKNVPQVAIAVHNFQSQPSKAMFFYVKALHSRSMSVVPFVIKTYWAYTRWTHISFSFIAEDRSDLQTGYYQIDSGSLSGCENGKNVGILLPFRNQFNNKFINHYLFIHGFQITTIPYAQEKRSPFEIQILNSSANATGITISVSVTSSTQVDSLYISYVAYQQTSLNLVTGFFLFDRNTSTTSLAHTPDYSIPRNYARIYGLRGFVFNYDVYRLSFSTRWDGFSFTFALQEFTSLTQYISFNYIFFIGSQCEQCLGYPIEFNGTCISICPEGTVRTPDNLCRDCGRGKVWNGKQCVIECPKGQYLNTIKNQCECPPSLNWNGETCIACTAGKIFVKQTLSCSCPQPLQWNGFACAQLEQCKNGKYYDVYSFSCVCPEITFWNGTYCANIVPCRGGQVHDMNYNCVCPENYYWSGSSCAFSPCFGGQVWQGTRCVCPAGKNYNGSMCIECINGQTWDPINKKCACQDGYKWNSQYCERTYTCTGNRVWNSTYQQCICKDSSFWSGYACLPIPQCRGGQYWNAVLMKCVCSTNFQWNGTACLVCRNGQIWDPSTLRCVCPPGTITVGGKCQIQQQCTGGKIFIQNSMKCQCPETTQWNGDYCISNPCTDGRQYSSQYLSCVCPDNKIWNNNRCIPPQTSCPRGMVWNNAIYACECPNGTFPNYNKCDPIPICRNGMTYNPLTNQCTCPFGKILRNFQCVDPDCPQSQYWNGNQCEVISCPPPSYFYQNRCIYGGPNQCTYGYIWNGQTCVLYPPTCPLGTQWRNSYCQSSVCQSGFYLDNSGQCNSLPAQCTPPASWVNQRCQISGGQCPEKTYLRNDKCQPYVPCSNGHIWDFTYLKCICPSGYISNGVSCIECSNGKSWDPVQGCVCPEGAFDTGTSCESLSQNRCSGVPNTVWESEKCKCRPGFTKIGFQCVCYGTQLGNLCDKCSHKPNSEWIKSSNICKCLDGYTEIRGNCIRNTIPTGNDNAAQCNVGTYFDSSQRMCLPCPDGCLSCFDCYRCRSCRPEFIYNPATQLCVELCGDGKRFVLECDDGNNKDGDGCTRDCKVETGFQCTGGSPDNKDSCYIFRPDRVTLQRTGEIRKSTSIVLNIKLNYLPSSLLFSGDCANNCNQVLKASLISGDRSAISIMSVFVVGTKYSFTVTVDFGRPYIGEFRISIGIDQSLVPKYFGAIPTDTLEFDVKPSYLAALRESDTSEALF